MNRRDFTKAAAAFAAAPLANLSASDVEIPQPQPARLIGLKVARWIEVQFAAGLADKSTEKEFWKVTEVFSNGHECSYPCSSDEAAQRVCSFRRCREHVLSQQK